MIIIKTQFRKHIQLVKESKFIDIEQNHEYI
jgi:hypothetical protein